MNTMSVLQILKKELKAQGHTYKDIARYLNLSEAGVKKLFSKKDIGLHKLSRLCELLQTNPADLLNLASQLEAESHVFSEKQVRFFISNKNYFHFFMKLAYEQKRPVEIQNEFSLSAKTMNMYLKKLEELELIKRHPFDRMQIIGGIPLAIKTTGTELEFLKYDIVQEQIQKLRNEKKQSLSGAGLFLTNQENKQFLNSILNLVLEYSDLSRTNRKQKNQNAAETTFMSYLCDGSMFNKISEL
jgi:DNA-binding CsgD family transcriptional regulator